MPIGLPEYLNNGDIVNKGNPLNRRKLGWWMSKPNSQSTSRVIDMIGKHHFTMQLSAGISHGGIRPGGFAASYDLTTAGSVGSTPLTPPTAALTMGCWFKTTNTNASIMGWNSEPTGNGGTYERTLYVEGGSNKLQWYVQGTYTATTPVANDGLWHFAVGTMADDGTTGRCYMDGVKYQGGAGYTPYNGYLTPYLCIGQCRGAGNSLQGCIDDWFYYDRCLTDNEIYALYAASKSKYQNQLNWYSHPIIMEATAVVGGSTNLTRQIFTPYLRSNRRELFNGFITPN